MFRMKNVGLWIVGLLIAFGAVWTVALVVDDEIYPSRPVESTGIPPEAARLIEEHTRESDLERRVRHLEDDLQRLKGYEVFEPVALAASQTSCLFCLVMMAETDGPPHRG